MPKMNRTLVPDYGRIDEARVIPKKDFRITLETMCKAIELLVGARSLVGQIHDMEDCPEGVRTAIEQFLEDSEGFADPLDARPWERLKEQ